MPQLWMKCEAMVYIMAIRLIMGARFVGIRVGGSRLRRIKTILLLMWPTTSPTFMLSPISIVYKEEPPPSSYLDPLPFCGTILDA